jgi:hypothetical protein
MACQNISGRTWKQKETPALRYQHVDIPVVDCHEGLLERRNLDEDKRFVVPSRLLIVIAHVLDPASQVGAKSEPYRRKSFVQGDPKQVQCLRTRLV